MVISIDMSVKHYIWLPWYEMLANWETAKDCYISAITEINSWPSDAIWRHSSGSTLSQVLDCSLTAPSHYLNQYWLIISKVHWHSSEGNFAKDTSATNHYDKLEISFLKFLWNLPGANELTENAKPSDCLFMPTRKVTGLHCHGSFLCGF